MSFDKHTQWNNHLQIKTTPKTFLLSLCIQPFPSLLKSLVYFMSFSSCLFRMLYKQKHTGYRLWIWFLSLSIVHLRFIQVTALSIFPAFLIIQQYSIVQMCHCQFIRSPVKDIWVFQFWLIMNKVTIYIFRFYVNTIFCFCRVKAIPLDIVVKHMFNFTRNCKKYFPRWLYNFAFPQARCESSGCSASLPALGIVSSFDFSHCNGCVVS